jgi:hypothetical protein
VLALGGAAALGLLLGAFNYWLLFGVVVCGMLVLALAAGFVGGRRAAVKAALAALFVVYALLVAAMAASDEPDSALRLILGLPAGTAALLYGVWPVPLAAALLYGLVFRSTLLPPEKLERFLAEYGRRDKEASRSRG